MLARSLFFGSQRRGSFNAVHLGHLHIHQHDVKMCLTERIQCLQPVSGHRYLVPALLQQTRGKFLIDIVVLGQKNVQLSRPFASMLQCPLGNQGFLPVLSDRAQYALNRFTQLRAPNRLKQIGRHSKLLASSRIVAMPSGG